MSESEFVVSALKWRPMKFEDVTGQEHVTVTLKNAISTNRIAHAYLFSGPRGVGKTTTARLLAKAVNCLKPPDPDSKCEMCTEITEGRSFDVLEIDGASTRGIEEIRNLRESARYTPVKAKYKVYIIDEVHMLTKEAFNALLKTLEEPPSHVLFIFATTEIQKVPATILSRCQRFEFRRISIENIISNLRKIAAEENITIDDEALMLIAKRGDGSLRDAQSMFDQVVSLCGTTITLKKILEALNIVDQELFFRLTGMLALHDASGVVALVKEVTDRGYDLKEFLVGLGEHLRNLLIARTTNSTDLLEVSDIDRKRYAEEAVRFSVPDLLRMIRFLNGTETAIRWSTQPRFRLEADLVNLAMMPGAKQVSDLLKEVDDLKKKIDEGQVSSFTLPVLEQPPPASPTIRSTAPPPQVKRLPLFQRASGTLPVSVTPPPSPTPTEGEINARWGEVVTELRQRQRLSLASILDSSRILGAAQGVIRIGCNNDFQASSITRGKELLAEVFHKVFNSRARVEVEISDHLPTPQDSPQNGNGSAQSMQEPNPIIQAIIKELGAEPIE
jgi:DNA polymerase-3 subunit gamma/tau